MCSEIESDSETPMCVQKLRAIVRQKLASMDLVTQDSKGSTEESSHILQYLFVSYHPQCCPKGRKYRGIQPYSSIFVCVISSTMLLKSQERLSMTCKFEVEELAIDLYYWFDMSTK